MTTTSAHAATSSSFEPIDGFADWMPLARSSYQRLADAFAEVPADRWDTPTPCEGWTVRDIAGHMVGAMRAAAHLRETMSQQRAVGRRARRTGEQDVDAMTAIQIERAAELSVEQVVAELQALVPKAVAGRGRMPGFLRRRAGFHVEMGDIDERWNLDYFLSAILTRDAWLHRVDLADALGTPLELDHDDRRIVGDVAVEWCQRHGQPATLVLTGPAGGTVSVDGDGDGDGPTIELDAVEFCRTLGGRAEGEGLLTTIVPF